MPRWYVKVNFKKTPIEIGKANLEKNLDKSEGIYYNKVY